MFKNKKVIIVLILVVATMVAAIGAYVFVNSALNQELKTKGTQLFTVTKGQTLNQVCAQLEAKNAVSNCLAIKLHAKLFDTYTSIQSGTYELKGKQPLSSFLNKLVKGDVKQYLFTIIEGENLYQVLDKVAGAIALSNDLEGKDHKAVAKALGLAEMSAEGWLYPETYYYPAGSSASQLLKRAVAKQTEVLQQQWQNKPEDSLIKTPYEALILASIIEKESSYAGERDKVSSVFHNRIKTGMRLQTDPTVIYGVWEKYEGDITRQHLREKNAYNTYRIDGLPPTPIANPSLASIEAALHPATTEYYYFVASGEGDHIFSTTLEQHNRALRNYLRKQRIKQLKETNG